MVVARSSYNSTGLFCEFTEYVNLFKKLMLYVRHYSNV
jgi:hypothetical protein